MHKLALLVWIASATTLAADDFSSQWTALQKTGDSNKQQAFLEQAANTQAENPNYYALAGNYWWQQAQSLSISSKPAAKGDFVLANPEDNKAVGSISRAGDINPKLQQKALNLLETGARKFPQRVDIALGLAHVQYSMDQKKACVATLLRLINEAKEHPKALTWTDNQPLPKPADDYIPTCIQSYSARLFRAETKETDVLCEQLTSAVIEAYPQHPFAYNIQAALVSAQGNNQKAVGLFEKLASLVPDDPLIRFNLALVYAKTKQREKAIQSYEQVLAMPAAQDNLKQDAKKRLAKLQQANDPS